MGNVMNALSTVLEQALSRTVASVTNESATPGMNTKPSRCDLADESAEAVRTQFVEFFRASRWIAPVGNTAASVGFAIAAHPYLPSLRLGTWLAVALSMSVLFWAATAVPCLARRIGSLGVPNMSVVAYALCGVTWGVTPWLALGPDATEYRWLALALMFALSAGTLGGTSGVRRLAVTLLFPLWIIGGAGFLVAGQLVVAASAMVFLAIMWRDSLSTTRLLTELVRLRESAAIHAEHAEWEANHDLLTGLPNRAGLLALADQARAQHRGHYSGTTTAMFIDLDHFKEVNDRFGHLAGDALLAETAHRLRATVRPDDVVGRLGGDEFLVLIFRDVSEIATAKLAERIITALEEPFRLATDDVYVSASIGITSVSQLDADVHRLVHESDKALAQAKRNGRRQAVVFDSSLRAQLSERSGLELALRKAIRSNQIEAWGQPVIDVASGRIAWVELLARWEASPGSFVPPSVFIPLAEEIGVVGDIGRQMLTHATGALLRWQTHPLLQGADAAVNISALHIIREDLVADISQLMACEGLPSHRLIVELTESHRLTDIDRVSAAFRKLGTMGVRLAIDDFGTGYSSLGQLLSLPVSIVKVDHSLTSGCDQDADRADVVRAIRQLAGALGHIVVAEGVETTMECEVMSRLGIDQAQGYLFCPPLPLEELERELQRNGRDWPTFGRDHRSKIM